MLEEIHNFEQTAPPCYCPELKYDSDEEFRNKRLNHVIGCVFMVDPNVIKKIDSLYDHKGFLTVIWKERPNAFEKKIVSFAWSLNDGCGLENTEHFMNVLELA